MWNQTKKKSGISFLKNKLNNIFNMPNLHKLKKLYTCRTHFIFFQIKNMDEINIFGQNNKLVNTFS